MSPSQTEFVRFEMGLTDDWRNFAYVVIGVETRLVSQSVLINIYLAKDMKPKQSWISESSFCLKSDDHEKDLFIFKTSIIQWLGQECAWRTMHAEYLNEFINAMMWFVECDCWD